MKYTNIILLAGVISLSACASDKNNHKKSWLCCGIPPLERPKSHWVGQDYKPSLIPEHAVLATSYNPSHTMFDNIDENLTPDEFIQNLKNASIIRSILNDRTGFFNQTVTDDIVITLDHNFYTLTYSDQKIITDFLAKSYEQDNFILKDASTKKIVGQITADGFALF
jgi:hypothetical protein